MNTLLNTMWSTLISMWSTGTVILLTICVVHKVIENGYIDIKEIKKTINNCMPVEIGFTIIVFATSVLSTIMDILY